jgi:hypothetical protein
MRDPASDRQLSAVEDASMIPSPRSASARPFLPRAPIAAALTALALLVAPLAAEAQTARHFTCYRARPTGGSPPFTARNASVVDQFRSSTVEVRRPQLLCAPTDKNGEDPGAPGAIDHLEDYKITPAVRFMPVARQTFVDQFGTHVLDVRKPLALQVPSTKARSFPPPTPAAAGVDHFTCYKTTTSKGAPRFTPQGGVTLQDQFGGMTVELRKIRRVCVPTNKNGESPGAENHPDHLVCYQIRQTSVPAFAPQSPLFVRNQFGDETLDAIKPRELCVPGRRPTTPTPTATPTATINPTAGSTTQAPTATPTALPILAGAAKVNMTPFTLTASLLACQSDPGCPYHDILALSNTAVSNPDGLPGGLFDQVGQEMAPGTASTDFIGPVGVWGEAFTDTNTNGRHDAGESFTDDPANSSPVVGAGHPSTLGDPQSTNKWDGAFIAGYGNDRIALGAFDPIWARVLFLRDTASGTSIAWVTLDVVGYFSDFVGRIKARLPADLDVDHIILTHTHDHESVDTVGLWGEDTTVDGTYRRWEIYVEAKIAQAITQAASTLQPARFRFGAIRPGESFVTPRGNSEVLDGMISRNSCRTPWVFDDELRVMQVSADPPSGGTIATLVNWGAHVESMDSRNKYISSDFAGAARDLVEQQLGGVALYAPAAQGAAEIIGDSCTRRWSRDTFDGETFAVDAGGEPLAFQDPYNNRAPRDRTYAIGRVVGSAAVAAATREAFDPPNPPFELIGPRLLCFPVNNEGLAALAGAGVIDKPLANAECPTGSGQPPDRAKSAFYALRIGSGSFVTAPGEVQPELYYGVSVMNRSVPIGDYVMPNPAHFTCAGHSHHGPDQPGAHSDRPYEPAIRPAQQARFGTRVNFLIGYTPDLLGYIVPGYDFFWLGGQGGFGIPVEEIEDPCHALPPDLAFPGAIYGSHYQETNSAGSMLAPAVSCEINRLLGDPFSQTGAGACVEWDLANATGRPPVEPPPIGHEPGCPADPTACEIRHY